jgi:hypothetical protein
MIRTHLMSLFTAHTGRQIRRYLATGLWYTAQAFGAPLPFDASAPDRFRNPDPAPLVTDRDTEHVRWPSRPESIRR